MGDWMDELIPGTVFRSSRIPLPGVTVRVCGQPDYGCTTVTTGTHPRSPGRYLAVLSHEGPRSGHWSVAIVDSEGRLLSSPLHFTTDLGSCGPDGDGHQWVMVDFLRAD